MLCVYVSIVLIVNCFFCSGSIVSAKVKEDAMLGKKTYIDKQLNVVLQDIAKLKDKFLHEVIDAETMRLACTGEQSCYGQKIKAKKQEISKATEQKLSHNAKKQDYWYKTIQNELTKKDKNARYQSTSWPEGTYGFPEPINGCPSGFSSGCRTHDCEDNNNGNGFHNEQYLKGDFAHDIRICYCVKSSSTSSASWPAGRYCINRVGSSCPSGFSTGFLVWDDENDVNGNAKTGVLPEGVYGSDTKMHYCCRSDGSVSSSITLPTDHPFVLYQHLSQGCQSVSGMTATEIGVKFDTDDYFNGDQCSTPVPYNPLCSGQDQLIFMCYYSA